MRTQEVHVWPLWSTSRISKFLLPSIIICFTHSYNLVNHIFIRKIEALRATGSEEKDPDPDLQHALQESERLVRCLRRENDEQRREVIFPLLCYLFLYLCFYN